MKTIDEMKKTCPQSGAVEWIGIRPDKRGPVKELESVDISIETSLEGDHYSKSGGKRQVTLIQREHINAVGQILDSSVDPSLLRRNIVVSGINLLALHDVKFKIGEDVTLEGTGYCHPCSRMEENLGPGGYNAMRGHGGITAKVVQGGSIKVGDEIVMLDRS